MAQPWVAGKKIAGLLLLVVLVILLALLVRVCKNEAGDACPARLILWEPTPKQAQGGAARNAQSPHIVVDTLNLTHHLLKSGKLPQCHCPSKTAAKLVDVCTVLEAIDYSAEILRPRFKGQIMFVTKDREREEDPTERARHHALYQAAARRNKVHVYVIERYGDEYTPSTRSQAKTEKNRLQPHAVLGRDDFFMGLLAWKHRCGVLTADKMRDYQELKRMVRPFRVLEYVYWRTRPTNNQVNPGARAYEGVRKPLRIAYETYGL